MQVVLSITAFLVAILSSVSTSDNDACKNLASVEKFASSFYTALIVDNDPNIVDFLKLPSGEASMMLYRVLKDVLESYRFCDADDVAFTGGLALASTGTVTLPYFFNKCAYTFAKVNLQKGLLTCQNAVALSLDLFKFVRKDFKDLDGSKFESYIRAIIEGLAEFYIEKGIQLVDVAQLTADMFKSEVKSDGKNGPKCKFDTSSD